MSEYPQRECQGQGRGRYGKRGNMRGMKQQQCKGDCSLFIISTDIFEDVLIVLSKSSSSVGQRGRGRGSGPGRGRGMLNKKLKGKPWGGRGRGRGDQGMEDMAPVRRPGQMQRCITVYSVTHFFKVFYFVS